MNRIEYKYVERFGGSYMMDNLTITALNLLGAEGWILMPSTLKRHNMDIDVKEGFDALFYREI